jgi:hypothetical protein
MEHLNIPHYQSFIWVEEELISTCICLGAIEKDVHKYFK